MNISWASLEIWGPSMTRALSRARPGMLKGQDAHSCARGGEGRGEGKEGTGRVVRLCHSQGRAASRGQPLRLSGPHSLTSADFMPDPIL